MNHKIIHCRNQQHGRYIGRPKAGQPWGFGNPFVIGKDGDRPTVIQKMKDWLTDRKTFGNKDATPERRQWILDHLHELKGNTVGCWCDYPNEDCHGRILLEMAEEAAPYKKTLAIIGTAGRGEDADKLTRNHYRRMIQAAQTVIKLEKITHLVSGGAAFSDWVIYEIQDLPKKTFLPAKEKDLETAKYYHNKFFAKITNVAKMSGEIINHGGFLDRNLLVAKEADIFLAMTFGDKNTVKDGGTKHTVDNMLKQGKFGYHLALGELKLYKNVK